MMIWEFITAAKLQKF
ncbi:rCG47025, partial [Rattus norvegicus]